MKHTCTKCQVLFFFPFLLEYHTFNPFCFHTVLSEFSIPKRTYQQVYSPSPPNMVKYTDLTWKSNTSTAHSKEHTYRHAHFYQTEPEIQSELVKITRLCTAGRGVVTASLV